MIKSSVNRNDVQEGMKLTLICFASVETLETLDGREKGVTSRRGPGAAPTKTRGGRRPRGPIVPSVGAWDIMPGG